MADVVVSDCKPQNLKAGLKIEFRSYSVDIRSNRVYADIQFFCDVSVIIMNQTKNIFFSLTEFLERILLI